MAKAYDINTRKPNEETVYHYAANGVRAEHYLTEWIRKNLRDVDVADTVRRVVENGASGVFISRPNGMYVLSADAITQADNVSSVPANPYAARIREIDEELARVQGHTRRDRLYSERRKLIAHGPVLV